MDTTWRKEARVPQENLETYCEGRAKEDGLDMGLRHSMRRKTGLVRLQQIVGALFPARDEQE